MFTSTNYTNNFPEFEIGASMAETSLSSLPFSFDKRHYKKDSRFVNDLYTLTYDDHESLDSVRLFSSFANQVSTIRVYSTGRFSLYNLLTVSVAWFKCERIHENEQRNIMNIVHGMNL